ncbi:MAG: hypothetical protein KDD82_00665 [Planctomycetes bacterium]|nr:hypothetical protein [Planctomycetota bacterium]
MSSPSSGKGSAITTPSEVYKRWAIMIHRREGERHNTGTWFGAPPRATQKSGAVWSAPPRAAALDEGMAITECLSRTAAERTQRPTPEAAPTPPPAPEPVVASQPEPEPEPLRLPQPATPYEAWSRAELYAKAKELQLAGRSTMTKSMLAQRLWALTA